MTPDYNDGKWHGWNGGECPVHPKTMIFALFDDKSGDTGQAQDWGWDTPVRPCAFRVVTPYREPREGYAVTLFQTAREAKTAHPGSTPIFVREVME